MRERYLIVIGCQKEKLNQIDKKIKKKILDFINGSKEDYSGVISILRRPGNGDENIRRNDMTIGAGDIYLDYESDMNIEVTGYDVDVKHFRKDCQYDIIGISTSASVLCIAMSMWSAGYNIRVLSEYCEDRKGKELEEYAFKIMKAYMPGCVK